MLGATRAIFDRPIVEGRTRMKKVDMLVLTHHMYTMAGESVGYCEDFAVAIDKGKILAVAPRADIEGEYTAEEVIDASNYLVLPGLIDAHMHTSMCAMRGVAQDVGNWMMHGAGPFSTNCTDKERAAGCMRGVTEAVLNGTPTIGEDGNNIPELFSYIEKLGVRGNISIRVREALPLIYAPGELYRYDKNFGEQTLGNAMDAFHRWNGAANGRIRVMYGPQGADFVSEEMLDRVKKLAVENNTKVYMHLSQGSRETKQMEMRYGMRSIPWLLKKNYLDRYVIGIHLTDATDEETSAVAKAGAGMVLCPGSIGIIDGIVPPSKVFQDAGGMVGLGSDQAPGNNCHNIFNEMKLAALFNKIKYEDPEVMPCWKSLRMATIEGARAVGIDDVVGSLEAGKDADLILVDLRSPAMMPIYTSPMRNMIPNLVYSATGSSEVHTVIAGGRVIVRDHKLLGIDWEKIADDAQAAADCMAADAEEEFWKINGVNARYMKAGLL